MKLVRQRSIKVASAAVAVATVITVTPVTVNNFVGLNNAYGNSLL
jgi:hypothetical protein